MNLQQWNLLKAGDIITFGIRRRPRLILTVSGSAVVLPITRRSWTNRLYTVYVTADRHMFGSVIGRLKNPSSSTKEQIQRIRNSMQEDYSTYWTVSNYGPQL